MEIKRNINLPKKSFFLFGARGTGKSTWLKKVLPEAEVIDLLRSKNYLALLKNPGLIRDQITVLPKESWVVIDEIQKLPILLTSFIKHTIK